MEILSLYVSSPQHSPFSTEVTEAVYCHLESRVSSSRTLRVACAGREHCRPDYHVIRPGYVCRGFELVIQGRGELRLGDKVTRLLPGHIFLYGPGIAHDIRCHEGSPMTKYFVDFFGGAERDIFLPGVIRPGELRRVPDPAPMARLFDSLIEEGKKVGPNRQAICAAYMKILLLKSVEAGAEDARADSRSLDNLNRCRAYMEEHASDLTGLQALADTMHLDPRYICRLFKRYHLPTPYHFLVSLKMSRAAELLVVTNEPVKSIASRVGYEDALHFSRVFRQQFDCPPSEFRNHHSKH